MVIKPSQSEEVFSKLEFLELQKTLYVHTQMTLSSGLWSSSSWHGFLRHVCPKWYEQSRRGRWELSASLFVDEEVKLKVMKSKWSLNPWQN